MEAVVTEVMVHPIMRRLLQTNNGSNNSTMGNVSAKFNPSMAIIIIVLISAFLFLGFFSIYLRRCTSSEERRGTQATQASRGGQPAPVGSPGQGLDREVVEALPLINYNLVKEVKGGKETTECAVCLSDFEDDEDLRLLPKCGHVFHPECIDMWFHSHSTCPLCRTTVMPDPEGKEGATYSEEFQAWTNARGGGAVDPEAVMIHDGPPVPPNGAILELLSREDADTVLAGSLRRDGDDMARMEEDENGERAVEIRALNRALSNNSSSFRRALRTYSATQRMGSARFNSSSVTVAGVDGDIAQRPAKNRTRSFGSSQSFNTALRRSSSVGSSGRYIRQMMGMHTESLSPDTQDSPKYGKSRIVGAYRVLNAPNKSNDTELRNFGTERSVQIPVWDQIDLNGDVAHSPTSQKPGSGGRKFVELPPGARLGQVDLHDEASGQLYERRKGKESVEERTKSDRWTFGQSLRRSLRRTFSDSRDSPDISSDINGDSGAKWYSHIMPPSSTPTSIAKKFASPWVAAMKTRRQSSGEIPSSPSTPSGSSFPQSLPIHDDHQSLHQSLPIDEDHEQLHDAIPVLRGHQHQSQEEPPTSPSDHLDNIRIVTQR